MGVLPPSARRILSRIRTTCRNSVSHRSNGIMATRIRLILLLGCTTLSALPASGFEGRIIASQILNGVTQTWSYTVSAQHIRIDCAETNFMGVYNIVDRQSGEMILVYPFDHAIVRISSPSATTSHAHRALPVPSEAGMMPAFIHGARSEMRMSGADELALRPTGETNHFHGYPCGRYEIEWIHARMEIWATEEVFPFQRWRIREPFPRFGPPILEEDWSDLLRKNNLFPMFARVTDPSGRETYRFEVKSISEEAVADPDGQLFSLPPNYRELRPSSLFRAQP